GFVGVAGTRLVRVLPEYQDEAEAMREGLKNWMIARGIEPERVFSLDLINPSRLLALTAGFLGAVGKVLSQALLVILIVAYILAERGLHGKVFQPGGVAGTVA